jgi:hypothetical protein
LKIKKKNDNQVLLRDLKNNQKEPKKLIPKIKTNKKTVKITAINQKRKKQQLSIGF